MFLRPACLMLLLLISNKQERSLGYQVTWEAADTVRIKYYVDTCVEIWILKSEELLVNDDQALANK